MNTAYDIATENFDRLESELWREQQELSDNLADMFKLETKFKLSAMTRMGEIAIEVKALGVQRKSFLKTLEKFA